MSGKYKFYYNQSFFSDYTIKEDEFNSSCENEISSISIE